CAKKSILRLAHFVNQRKHNRGKTGSCGVEITVRREMHVTVFAQLVAGCDRAVSTEVEGFHAGGARRNGQNLIGLRPGKWQSRDRKLAVCGSWQMLESSRRLLHVTFSHRSAAFESHVSHRKHRIRDHSHSLWRGCAMG